MNLVLGFEIWSSNFELFLLFEEDDKILVSKSNKLEYLMSHMGNSKLNQPKIWFYQNLRIHNNNRDVLFEYHRAGVPFSWAVRPVRSLSTL